MTRGIVTLLTLVSVIFFAWPYSAVLAIAAAFVEPFAPLAAGLFTDILYYSPHASGLPLFTLWGGVATLMAFLVRRWLKASIIGG